MPDDLPDSKPLPQSGAPPVRTTGGSTLWTPPSPEHLQRLLPQYEIISILGRGGMGAVYKGRQISLDRLVAIKLLPREALEDNEEANFTERFKNEARSMAKMNHPAIFSVYDFGETSEGQLYIVMEYVDATDVAKMITEQRSWHRSTLWPSPHMSVMRWTTPTLTESSIATSSLRMC
jgi:serine/threonine protein kinase